jgi:DNA-binding response OmpR family regulator
LGEGSVFTVDLRFPNAPESAHSQPAFALENQPEAGAAEEVGLQNSLTEEENFQTKVLVVEDNDDLRQFIRENLPGEYLALEAENGIKGWEIALNTLPDLIISDVMMPGMDGITLCHQLKKHPVTAHIPVILLTARADTEDRIEGLLTGADDYITKPFQARELSVRVRNLIEERKRLREYFRREVLVQPVQVQIPSADEKFIQKVMDAVESNLSDPDFDVEALGRAVGLSRVQLYRKLFALTSQPPSDFLRTLRLKRAAGLLSRKAGNISEIAYLTGFREASHFSRCFSQQYGRSPSDFMAHPEPE